MFEDVSPENRTSKRLRVPFLQTVHVSARDLGVEGLTLEILGFGELDAVEPLTGPRGQADLLLATLSWQGLPDRMLFLRVGRQLVHGGAANNAIIDGIHGRLRLPLDLSVEAWGGLTAEPDFEEGFDRWQAGARVAWSPFDHGHVGLSFAHERVGGEPSREVVGLDFGWRTLLWLELFGHVLFDTIAADLEEAQAYLDMRFTREVRGDVYYRRSNPSARIPKTSIFSVFANTAFDEVGTSVGYSPTRGHLGLHGRASVIVYGPDDVGVRAALRPRWVFDRLRGELIGLEVGRVSGSTSGYWSARLYGVWAPIDRLRLSADTEHAIYDAPIEGRSFSSIARVNASIELTKELRLMAEGGVTVSPTLEQSWVALLRLTYQPAGSAGSRAVMP